MAADICKRSANANWKLASRLENFPTMDATNWHQSNDAYLNRRMNEPPKFGTARPLGGVHGTISVTVLCADPVIAAGLAAVLGSHRHFEIIPARETQAPNDAQPPANVILADYETAMHLAKCAPQWMRRLLVFSNCDSEARICLALQNGARGYLLHGASITELIDAVRSVLNGGVALSPAVAARVANRVSEEGLTPRERAVLEQLMHGVSNKVIAFRLNICLGTVKTHIKSILRKLNAQTRTAAVITAQRRGLL